MPISDKVTPESTRLLLDLRNLPVKVDHGGLWEYLEAEFPNGPLLKEVDETRAASFLLSLVAHVLKEHLSDENMAHVLLHASFHVSHAAGSFLELEFTYSQGQGQGSISFTCMCLRYSDKGLNVYGDDTYRNLEHEKDI
jgi:hypothetical protein